MQLIPLKKFNIQTCFFQFLWFFRLKCWFKGQIISRIHLSLANAFKLLCFDRNINGNRDVKFIEWDYWSLHWRKNLTLDGPICTICVLYCSEFCTGWYLWGRNFYIRVIIIIWGCQPEIVLNMKQNHLRTKQSLHKQSHVIFRLKKSKLIKLSKI